MERNTFYHEKGWHWGLRIVGWVILGLMAATVFAFLFGFFVMLLWNWLMPELFGLATITFWKAFGIVLLARLIFGGFKHSYPGNKHDYRRKKFLDHWRRKECRNNRMKDWRYFDDYWYDEGEKAFNEYVERKKEQSQ